MRIENTKVERYQTLLVEPSRPPSKGGDTRAWHTHVVTVDGQRYSFLALGSKRWVYASDVVSFDWDWDSTGKYRNIDPGSIQTWDKNGKLVERGERGGKRWRTATPRMPVSTREQRD